MRIHRAFGLSAAVVCLAGLSVRCSPSSNTGGERDPIDSVSGDPDASGGMSTTGAGGTTFTGAGGSQGLFNPGTGSMTGTGGDPNAMCAATSQQAEQIEVEVPVVIEEKEPVALFVMLDRSSSMVGVLGDPNGWPGASQALSTFVNDMNSAGLDMALAFFPTLAGTAACDGSDCGVPVVPMGRLPDIAPQIQSTMQSATPPAFPPLLTPTMCALRGMIEGCKAHTAATGVQCVALLVTDGAPTLCNIDTATNLFTPQDLEALKQVVADGKAAGVITYTIGMTGSDFNVLNQLAEAGGSDCDPSGPAFACDVQAGPAAFIASLNAIRKTVSRTETRTEYQSTKLDCEWKIPEPEAGDTFDRNKVNVDFEARDIAKQSIGAVPDAAACAQFQGGWHYDDPAAPEKIVACPETCDVIKGAYAASIDIVLGCETIVSDPR